MKLTALFFETIAQELRRQAELGGSDFEVKTGDPAELHATITSSLGVVEVTRFGDGFTVTREGKR